MSVRDEFLRIKKETLASMKKRREVLEQAIPQIEESIAKLEAEIEKEGK